MTQTHKNPSHINTSRKTALSGARILLLAGASLAMGMTLPSCPGQQALQTQIDSIQAKQVDAQRKIQALEGKTQGFGADIADAKQNAQKAEDLVGIQGKKIEELEGIVRDLQTKSSAPAKKSRRK